MSSVEIRTEKKLRRWGHGYGVYLTEDELRRIGLRPDKPVSLEITTDGKIIIKPKPASVEDFLDFIGSFEFGEAVKVGEATIIPLLAREVGERDYVTYKESENISIRDTGRIDRMVINNASDRPVFFPQGTVLKGGTQSRALIASTVLEPGESCEAPVRCVHRTGPIHAGETVKPEGFAPRPVAYSITAPHIEVSQATTWRDVSTFALRMMSADTSSEWRDYFRRTTLTNDLAECVRELRRLASTAAEKFERAIREREARRKWRL